MTTSDNNKKGFDGFNDLVSDVTKEVEVSAKKWPSTTSNPSPNSQPKAQQQPRSGSVQSQNTAQTHSSNNVQSGGAVSNWGWWVAGIIFVLVIVIESGEKDNYNLEAPTANEHKVSDSNSSFTSPEELPEPEPKSTEVSNQEEIPPVGTGLVLSHNQIRYCLSEDLRLSTIQKSLDSNSKYEIDSFNAVAQDYNSRCSNFKYSSGLLESVQSQVTLNHASLIIEGLTTLDSWRERAMPTSNVAPPVNVALPKKNRPEIQVEPDAQSSNFTLPDSTIPVQKKYSNLFAAVQSGDIEATEQMLSQGANINPVVGAYPPLIAAIYIDNSAMVELLLNHGANPNSKNSRGESAMMIAKTLGKPNKEIIEHLYLAGATDPFAK